MNELSGCFGPDRFGSNVGRPPTAVAVETVRTEASRVGAPLWFSIAGELPPVGDSFAVSCRYALMNARFVVDMASLSRGCIHEKAGVAGHGGCLVRFCNIGQLTIRSIVRASRITLSRAIGVRSRS